MSIYEEQLAWLESKKCEHCHGSGRCNDAEPGDIFCREWVCTVCNGTGFKKTEDPCPIKST